ncbi:MAG: hypothetical protein AABW83_03650 [Nanoarchaeota archaeon]
METKESKTIKVSKENYLWLLKLAGDMQKEYHKPVSFDIVLKELKNKNMKKKKSILKFAGIWKDMSDEETERLKKDIKELREKSTRDLIKNDIYRF